MDCTLGSGLSSEISYTSQDHRTTKRLVKIKTRRNQSAVNILDTMSVFNNSNNSSSLLLAVAVVAADEKSTTLEKLHFILPAAIRLWRVTIAIILLNIVVFTCGIHGHDYQWTVSGRKLTKAAKDLSEGMPTPVMRFFASVIYSPNAMISHPTILTELPFYVISDWIHWDIVHLLSNMISFFYTVNDLEEKKGSRFVLLSTLIGGMLVGSLLKAIYLLMNQQNPYMYYALRFGVGFSAICCHFETLIALDSSVDPLKRLFFLFIIVDSVTDYKTFLGPRQIHWGHLMGVLSGLCQAGCMAMWCRLKSTETCRIYKDDEEGKLCSKSLPDSRLVTSVKSQSRKS